MATSHGLYCTVATHFEAGEVVREMLANGLPVYSGVGNPVYRPHVQAVTRYFNVSVTIKPQGDWPEDNHEHWTIIVDPLLNRP